ncbi:MAG: DJ-1/PfpI family protein, partial [Planctomycetes bacterium]|nr:DJ-1/PfpI family protein [Planctomycetota bacterium]
MRTYPRLIGSSHSLTGLLLASVSLFLISVCVGQDARPRTQRRARRNANIVKVILPAPRTSSSLSLEELLASQGPLQMPASTPLDVGEIGQLAWAAQGVHVEQRRVNGGNDPSAGMQLLFVTAEGIFRYAPRDHSLEQLTPVDFRAPLVLASQGRPGQSVGCGILITRSTMIRATRENNRAKRLLNLRVGQMAQVVRLQAAALGLVTLDVADFDSHGFRLTARLPREMDPLHVLLVGYRSDQAAGEHVPSSEILLTGEDETVTTRGKAALLIASSGFRDEELFDTGRVLNAAGIDTAVAAARVGVALGMLGGVVQVTVAFSKLDVAAYDAIVLIGGSGAGELARNDRVASIVKDALRQGKIVAAIDGTT